jgi:hypothetical protein
LFLALPCGAKIITVDDDSPADFNSIQLAIDSASDGDIIIAQPGLYQESINFLGKNITLTSTNPANPNIVAATIIGYDDGNEAIVTFRGSEDTNCTIVGFNINGSIEGYDWTIDPAGENHTHATISYCRLEGNEGGPSISGCDGTINNCVIADNINQGKIIPIVYPAIFYCHGLIKNCTIANNNCASAIELGEGGETTIENCIIYGNTGDQIFADCPATVSIRYSDVEGGLDGIWLFGLDCTLNWGPGNVDEDPYFARVGYWDFNEPWTFFEGDYHLQSEAGRWDPNTSTWVTDANTSACINAGNPGCPVSSEPLPNGNRINMGAYGGTATASKTPANWRSIADLTNNWVVDYNDLDVFIDYWLDVGQCIPSDLNRSQSVDFTDFGIFADNWLWW